MPGQAARGGRPSRRTRRIRPSTTEPASSLPNASAPAEKCQRAGLAVVLARLGSLLRSVDAGWE